MRIGELARRTGVSQRLLRYYEAQGLLTASRGANGYREYDAEAPTVVAQIRGLLEAGLGTSVIRDLLPCARGPEPDLEPCSELVARLRAQLDGLESRIACLEEHRSALRRYLDATAPNGSVISAGRPGTTRPRRTTGQSRCRA
jgi:DNA-binding transcriptional MerR regulator